MKNKKIYEIGWYDITSYQNKGKEKVLKNTPHKHLTESVSYGYILSEDDKAIIVVSTDNGDLDYIAIPKGCIRYRKILKDGRKT